MPPKKRVSFHVPASVAREIWAVFFAIFGVLLIMALQNNLGIGGKYAAHFLTVLFGQGAWIFPFMLFGASISLILSRFFSFSLSSLFGIFLLFFGIEGFLHLVFVPENLMNTPSVDGGGMLGLSASILFRMLLGEMGAMVFLTGVVIAGVLLAFQISLSAFFYYVGNFIHKIFGFLFSSVQVLAENTTEKSVKKEKSSKIFVPKEEKIAEGKDGNFEIRRGEVKKMVVEKPEKPVQINPEDQNFSDWIKPNIALLNSGSSTVHVPDSELLAMGKRIVEKLGYFDIGTTMKSAFVGPTVTQFALEPDESVKLSRITGLKNEIALALSAESVRIEAPIPGKNLVGIEIPNPKRATVFMREILESKEFVDKNGSLKLCVGKDVSGHPVVENLEEMPHLLIAGSTGSGKSVGMNAFLISMLFENSPADLRFIFVDPKRVELMPYEGIPHLLTPVITDAAKALSALRWAVSEMMRRLEEFASRGARNIAEYNEKMDELQKNAKSDEEIPKKMPKIVIVIDELADLMMREHKKETEAMICRIAQMARAVGMHLIIATQRPSVDVITGLIKANIPTRIAFSVTSAIDSRTVLDCIGAEDLLGKGDMLFSSPKTSRPRRIQGIYISGEEIEKVVQHLKMNISDEFFFENSINLDGDDGRNETMGNFGDDGDNDDLLEDAIDLIRSSGKASASLLQRRLSVGYARAARILDIMEKKGMIGPSKGAKAREIFL